MLKRKHVWFGSKSIENHKNKDFPFKVCSIFRINKKEKERNAHHAKTQEVVQKYYAMNILNLPSFSACLSFEVDKSQKVSKNDLTKKEK